jgi:MoxR-like ATPase
MAREREQDTYRPLVAIRDVEDFRSEDEPAMLGDRRDGKLYRYTPEIKLSVNVALATGRPLLIIGATGCGKSSLAFNLARLMGRRYYEFVVTSRSQARDLFYRFDAVRRLGDSQSRVRHPPADDSSESLWQSHLPYVEPGPLWWILDRTGAERRGYPGDRDPPFSSAVDPVIWEPETCLGTSSLLLIDEIDKADPDFPSNLLVPLGSWQFTLEEVAMPVSLVSGKTANDPTEHPLVVITSNRERELPDTFLRRCIVLEIPTPEPDQLLEIATTVFGPRDDRLYDTIADKLEQLRGRDQLSIAEYLDAVQAIQVLEASGELLSQIIERSAWRPTES